MTVVWVDGSSRSRVTSVQNIANAAPPIRPGVLVGVGQVRAALVDAGTPVVGRVTGSVRGPVTRTVNGSRSAVIVAAGIVAAGVGADVGVVASACAGRAHVVAVAFVVGEGVGGEEDLGGVGFVELGEELGEVVGFAAVEFRAEVVEEVRLVPGAKELVQGRVLEGADGCHRGQAPVLSR